MLLKEFVNTYAIEDQLSTNKSFGKFLILNECITNPVTELQISKLKLLLIP